MNIHMFAIYFLGIVSTLFICCAIWSEQQRFIYVYKCIQILWLVKVRKETVYLVAKYRYKDFPNVIRRIDNDGCNYAIVYRERPHNNYKVYRGSYSYSCFDSEILPLTLLRMFAHDNRRDMEIKFTGENSEFKWVLTMPVCEV